MSWNGLKLELEGPGLNLSPYYTNQLPDTTRPSFCLKIYYLSILCDKVWKILKPVRLDRFFQKLDPSPIPKARRKLKPVPALSSNALSNRLENPWLTWYYEKDSALSDIVYNLHQLLCFWNIPKLRNLCNQRLLQVLLSNSNSVTKNRQISYKISCSIHTIGSRWSQMSNRKYITKISNTKFYYKIDS